MRWLWLRRLTARLRRGERGTQLVEFALVLPVALIVVMGVLDVGRLMGTYTILKNAAREAALYAAKYDTATSPPTTSDLKTAALAEGKNFLSSSKLSVSVSDSTWSYGSSSTQTAKTVQLTYSFDFSTPILSITNPLTVTTTASAMVP